MCAEALRGNNEQFIELAKAQFAQLQLGAKHDLDTRQKAVEDLVGPIKESLERVGGEVKTPREGAPPGCRAADRATEDGRGDEREVARRDRQPRHRAAGAGRARPLGRDAAARAVEPPGCSPYCDFDEQMTAPATTSAAAAPRPGRPAAGRTERRRRREDAAPGAARRARRPTTRTARARNARRLRAPRPRAHREAGAEELLGAVRRRARLRRHVPAGRELLPRRARAGPEPARAAGELGVDPRQPDDADHAAADDRRRLAARRRSPRAPARSASSAASSTSGSRIDGRAFRKLGSALDGAVQAYNQTVGSFETARARLRAASSRSTASAPTSEIPRSRRSRRRRSRRRRSSCRRAASSTPRAVRRGRTRTPLVAQQRADALDGREVLAVADRETVTAVRERLVHREVEAVRRARSSVVPSSGQLPSAREPRPHAGSARPRAPRPPERAAARRAPSEAASSVAPSPRRRGRCARPPRASGRSRSLLALGRHAARAPAARLEELRRARVGLRGRPADERGAISAESARSNIRRNSSGADEHDAAARRRGERGGRAPPRRAAGARARALDVPLVAACDQPPWSCWPGCSSECSAISSSRPPRRR